ncbi:MAG: hypothetical protein AB8B91_08945 [Rubripirellula sp.]
MLNGSGWKWFLMHFGAKNAAAIMLMIAAGSVTWACYGLDGRKTAVVVQQLGDMARWSQGIPNSSNTLMTLRERRHEGLQATLKYRDQRVAELGGVQFAEVENLDRAIDVIAGQKFASASRLFWHTSIDDATAESQATNRPIISLRLLGRLDENLSCANSRFFRTVLYPDPKIAAKLRNRFVLHWQSVREVPVVTIDLGNGKKVQQPLTGNSVHLVLNEAGKPIDALPGLVSPHAFEAWLDATSRLWDKLEHDSPQQAWAKVAQYHAERATQRRLKSEMAIGPDQQVSELNPLDSRWLDLAKGHQVQLARASFALLEAQRPAAEAAMAISFSKSIAEAPVLRVVQQIEPSIAKDTVFNVYGMQTKIDDWFSRSSEAIDDAALTTRIYAEVFLMPLSDPWLGLSPDTHYTALDNGGRVDSNIPTTTIAAAKFQATSATRPDLEWVKGKSK